MEFITELIETESTPAIEGMTTKLRYHIAQKFRQFVDWAIRKWRSFLSIFSRKARKLKQDPSTTPTEYTTKLINHQQYLNYMNTALNSVMTAVESTAEVTKAIVWFGGNASMANSDTIRLGEDALVNVATASNDCEKAYMFITNDINEIKRHTDISYGITANMAVEIANMAARHIKFLEAILPTIDLLQSKLSDITLDENNKIKHYSDEIGQKMGGVAITIDFCLKGTTEVIVRYNKALAMASEFFLFYNQ